MVRIESHAAHAARSGPAPARGIPIAAAPFVRNGLPVPDYRQFAYLGTFQNVLASLLDVLPAGPAGTPNVRTHEGGGDLPLPALTPKTSSEVRAERAADAQAAAPAAGSDRRAPAPDEPSADENAVPAVAVAPVVVQPVEIPAQAPQAPAEPAAPPVVESVPALAPVDSAPVETPVASAPVANEPVASAQPVSEPLDPSGVTPAATPSDGDPPEAGSQRPAVVPQVVEAPLPPPKPHAEPAAPPVFARFAAEESRSQRSGTDPSSSPTPPPAPAFGKVSPAPEAVPVAQARFDAPAPQAAPLDPVVPVEPPPAEPRPHAAFDRILGLDVEEILQSLSASGRDSASAAFDAAAPAAVPAAPVVAGTPAASVVADAAPALDARPAAPPAVAGVRGPTAAVRAGATPAPSDLPGSEAAERVEFVEKIVRAARAARTSGGANLRMVLHPPQLGHLRVDLSMRAQVLHGRLSIETEDARDLVRANLGALREALEGQGIRVGTLEVAGIAASSGQGPGTTRPDAAFRPAERNTPGRPEDRGERRVQRAEAPAASPARGSRRRGLVDVLA
jgi:hypothetical protein